MSSKSSSSKSKTKNEKSDTPRRKITLGQIVFGIFALLMIITMVLSSVSLGS